MAQGSLLAAYGIWEGKHGVTNEEKMKTVTPTVPRGGGFDLIGDPGIGIGIGNRIGIRNRNKDRV